MRIPNVLAALGAATSGAAIACPEGFHCTNSHLHKEVRQYPLHREGHHRGSPEKHLPDFEPDYNSIMSRVMKIKIAEREQCEAAEKCPLFMPRSAGKTCTGGSVTIGVDDFDCHNTNLLAFVPIKDMDSDREASDIWGWTDPETNDNIAIIGMEDRTAFVKVTRAADDTVTPVVIATLMQSGYTNVIWSDMKVYGNHVFIVRESDHGMQVLDLTTLRQHYNTPYPVPLGQDDLADFYDVVIESGEVDISRSVHNVVINEATGFAYLVGSKTCKGGLHVVDISSFGTGQVGTPKAKFAGCFSEDGYTHDAQCVIYEGPDEQYRGKELCWAYNEDSITLVDVSDKTDMKIISNVTYPDASYTHQGWLTPEHRYIIANDELDEVQTSQKRTRTLVWDYESLTDPQLLGYRLSDPDIQSVDHNLYISEKAIYLSNYCSGLRVYKLGDNFPNLDDLVDSLPQVAFFDTAPYCDTVTDPVFKGAWSSYPYFEEDGMVIVSSIETGLYILDVNIDGPVYRFNATSTSP